MKKNSNWSFAYKVKLFVGDENGYLGNMKFVIICVIISIIITLVFMDFFANLRRMKEGGIIEPLPKSSIIKIEQNEEEHGDEPDMSQKNNEKFMEGINKTDGTIEKSGHDVPSPSSTSN